MSNQLLHCLHAGRLTVDDTWAARSHAHPFVEVMVVLEGRLEVEFDGDTTTAAAGDVLYYAPRVAHSEKVPSGDTADFIFFAALNGPSKRPPRLTHDTGRRIRILAQWLFDEHALSYDKRQDSLDALSAAILAEIGKLNSVKPQTPIERIRSGLRAHLGESHTIDELAGRAGMGKFSFMRAYKRTTGRTPMDDLRALRVEAACDLLLTTGLPLKQIARRVGFCDEYYFSRVFRRLRGMPPSAFRRSA